MTKQRGLGKGLQEMGLTELLSSINKPASNHSGQLIQVEVAALEPGTYQPRRQFNDESLEELAQSIRSQGVIQPLIVRMTGVNKYEIIAGERRWRASQIAGVTTVPAVVKDMDNEAAMAIGLIENMQREDLNAIDLAEGMDRLLNEFSLTHQTIATILGKSRTSITNTLRLLQLDDDVQSLVKSNKLEMGHARSLLALDATDRLIAAEQVVRKQLSVRATEDLVRSWKAEPSQKKTVQKQVSPDDKAVADALSKHFDCAVRVSGERVTFSCKNTEKFEAMISKLLSS